MDDDNNNEHTAYVRSCDIPLDKAVMIEASPAVTLQFLHDLRRNTGIFCICKKTSLYYDGRIEKITGDGDKKTFTVHFTNYNKKHQQQFTFGEARHAFLPYTNHVKRFIKKYNETLHSYARHISVQEREACDDSENADDEENEDAPAKQMKPLPEMNIQHCESLKILVAVDKGGKLITRYPPRCCIDQLLKEFQDCTNIFDFFNEYTLERFLSDFESSFMFTNQHIQASYEKNAALEYYMKNWRIRNLPPITREEIDIRIQLFGHWKAEINVRHLYGVVQLIRYMTHLYSRLYQIEQERTLEGKEEEIILVVTTLANFIHENRERYFCEGKDFTQPMDES